MEASSGLSLPPGFGFHPTDAELISHYLKRKILGYKIEFNVIPEIDIYKYEPWDLPAKSLITTRDSKWHFFTSRDKKYPNGSRSNRATAAGYWKSTGKDRNIRLNNRIIGTKKTLVFHQGRPPHGKRSEWIMHEYYLNEDQYNHQSAKDTFVLCRVTKRSSSTQEEEEELTLPQEEKSIILRHSISKKNNINSLEDIFLGMMPKKEIPSPSEELIDLDSWFAELSNPTTTPELPSSQPINPTKMTGDLISIDDVSFDGSRDTNASLWEEFLEVNQDLQEVNFGLLFEDPSPISIDSLFDYNVGPAFLSSYDIYTGHPSLINSPRDGEEVNTNRVRLDAHKVTPGIVDQTFYLDSDSTGPSSTYEVRAHVIEDPTSGAPQQRSFGWFPHKGSSKAWMRSGRRARISRRCRDCLKRARGFVKGVRGLIGRSPGMEVRMNYIFWLACMIASAMVTALCMLVDVLTLLYACACQ